LAVVEPSRGSAYVHKSNSMQFKVILSTITCVYGGEVVGCRGAQPQQPPHTLLIHIPGMFHISKAGLQQVQQIQAQQQ
jgi:hypothetical protein